MDHQFSYTCWSQKVIEECNHVLLGIKEEDVEKYLDILKDSHRIFFIGVGRVLLSLKCIAKRYNHLGMNCSIVGDITEPAITPDDVLIVGSGSGNTLIPVAISQKAKSLGATVVQIGCNADGNVGKIADLFIRIPAQSKKHLPDEIASEQPMTSLFEQSLLLFGDITAAMIMSRNSINPEKLWQYHANLE